MLESFNVNHEMEYQKLSIDEQQQRGILGRLVGVIADFKNPTRNGRRYTEELWDKTFNNPIMKEKFENKCLFGELGHPADRTEVDMEKVAICLAEPPKKGTDGKLYGVFDILSTPNGKILKTFCDYGCKIGVSSRGSGDTFQDYDGNETVEPDSYECECWDAVLLPAVKDARPQYVTESLNTQKPLRVALQEALSTSDEDDRKIMQETLDSLEIDYLSEQDKNNPEKIDNIDNVTEETVNNMEAENSGSDGELLLHELQESLRTQLELEEHVKTLQKQLSVCYTKEARYSDALNRAKIELTNTQTKNKTLEEQLVKQSKQIEETKSLVESQQKHIDVLSQRLVESKEKRSSLNEHISSKDATIQSLQEQIKSLTTKSIAEKKSYDIVVKENKRLSESLEDAKKDSQIVRSQYSAKLNKSQELVEKYRSIAKTATDKYINSQATRLGIRPEDIKNKLGESYSFGDIDKVCESLQKYKLTVNSLPFNLESRKPVKMIIKESKEVINTVEDCFDDEIDTTLSSFT